MTTQFRANFIQYANEPEGQWAVEQSDGSKWIVNMHCMTESEAIHYAKAFNQEESESNEPDYMDPSEASEYQTFMSE